MAISLENVPELQGFLVPNVRPTGRSLGHGAYCSVEEVEILGGLCTCAAKKIHDILLGSRTEICIRTAKFVEECQLMSSLRHPHIVQFLGICFLPGSRVPALIMEKLLTCVDELLERNPNIPLPIKRNILHDVAQGLAYLHGQSPPIIHRDLTAKNVLLNSSMVAKIADLGVARIVDIQPGQLAATMTEAPGNIVYMPPEALEPRARYGTKIDIFSLGNLAMYVLTQIFPVLLASTYYNSKRRMIVARSEIKRRFEYIQQIHQQLGSQHPLVQMVEQCLRNNPQERPSIGYILCQLEQARALIPDQYGEMNKLEMIQQLQCKDRQIGNLQTEIQTKCQQLQTQQQQLQFKDHHIRNLQAEVEEKKADSQLAVQALQVTRREIQQQREQLLSKDRQIRNLQAKVQSKGTENQQLTQRMRNMESESRKQWETTSNVMATTNSPVVLRIPGKKRDPMKKQWRQTAPPGLAATLPVENPERLSIREKIALFKNSQTSSPENSSLQQARPLIPMGQEGQKFSTPVQHFIQTASDNEKKSSAPPGSAAPLPVENPERLSIREKIALFKNSQTSSPENSSQQQARP